LKSKTTDGELNMNDLRYATRQLLKNRGFTFVAILTLALGIGANTTIFSVVYAVLLRPLPYKDPDRVVVALHDGTKPVSPADFRDWREQNTVFEQMAAASLWSPNMTGRDQPEQIRGLQATGNLFDMLGSQAALGRAFTNEEDRKNAQPVVVLSDQLWKRRFGGDAAVIGQTLTLDGQSHTVIGVMPPAFQFPFFWATGVEMWTPLKLDPADQNRSARFLRVFGRLKADSDIQKAQTEMSVIAARIAEAHPATNNGVRVTIAPLHERVVGKVRSTLLLLLAAVAFVLIIACVNVANLLLTRASARQKEIAVRSALGATRWRIVRQLLTESLLLASAGGAIGIALAVLSLRLVVPGLPVDALPRQQAIEIDAGVLGFTILLCVLTSVIFGLAPALLSSKNDLTKSLKAAGKNQAGETRGPIMRSGLVVIEIALAMVLLVGAGLLTRSFVKLQSIDPGFNAENVLAMKVSVAGTPNAAKRGEFFREVVRRMESLPGVKSASAINHLPLSGDRWGTPFAVEGQPAPPPGQSPTTAFRFAHPKYFQTMGIALLSGRDFDERDNLETPRAIIVNEVMAHRYWPGEDAVGKRIKLGPAEANVPWISVVGVVKQVKQEDWAEDSRFEVYLPYFQSQRYLSDPASFYSYLTLVMRTDSDPASIAASSRREVWNLEPSATISDVETMEEVIAAETWQPRLSMFLLGGFAIIALLLAAVGVYGVMSYSVSRRVQEIGIRMALGARSGTVLWMIARHGLKLSLAGVGLGLAGAMALSRLMSGLLYEVQATDPATFALLAVVLIAVTLLACYLPARRAARVEPIFALRHE
jgi:predicted permease